MQSPLQLLIAACALFCICVAGDGQAGELQHTNRTAQEASVEMYRPDAPHTNTSYTSPGTCVGIDNVDDNGQIYEVQSMKIAPGLLCQFYFNINCSEPITGLDGVFASGTYGTDLALGLIAGVQCWPEQCIRPEPATPYSAWPSTLTCVDMSPSASPPVGFSYPFNISLYGQASSAAMTNSTHPSSTFATSASNIASSRGPPLSPAPTRVGGSVTVLTGVPTEVPTGSQVCIEFNVCDVSTAAS